MRLSKLIILSMLAFVLLVTACSNSNKGLTIEPFTLSDHEKKLVTSTGINNIKYFSLDGTLAKQDDLQYTIEVYKDGVLQQDTPFSKDTIQFKFNNDILSFGVAEDNIQNLITLITGTGNGYMKTNYDLEGDISGSTFVSLLSEKETIKLNQPVYLAAWAGSSGNALSSPILNSNGTPNIEPDTDVAYVLKLERTKRGK